MLNLVLLLIIFVLGIVQIFFAKDYFKVYKNTAQRNDSQLRPLGGVYGFFIGGVLILMSLAGIIPEIIAMF
jgi:hypothetical protein